MLAEEAEHGRHIGRDRIIDAEQIGDREMTPIVAVPPGEEEIGGTACLAGIALRQREQAGERAVDLPVLAHHLRLRRDRKSPRLNSSHYCASRLPSSS